MYGCACVQDNVGLSAFDINPIRGRGQPEPLIKLHIALAALP